MYQERWSSLATLSTENVIAQNLDFSELVRILQTRKREKSTLIKIFCKYVFFHTLYFFLLKLIYLYNYVCIYLLRLLRAR
jgi:hypothetical protein